MKRTWWLVGMALVMMCGGSALLRTVNAGLQHDAEAYLAKLNNADASDPAFVFTYHSMLDCNAEMDVCIARTQSIIPASTLSADARVRASNYARQFRRH